MLARDVFASDEARQSVRRALLGYRVRLLQDQTIFWPFLEPLNGRPADKRTANKFFLACIVDYQQKADRAWEQAKYFVEEIMGDPPDIWRAILEKHKSEDDWRQAKSQYRLHRWDKAHMRVYRIGRQLIEQYDGDARRIWMAATLDEIQYRLSELRVGDQISQMILGGLRDTGQIDKSADLKADTHVCRVLGRIAIGAPVSPEGATQLARMLNPEAPWLLDRPLYVLGAKADFSSADAAGCCSTGNPHCTRCDPGIRGVCTHHREGKAPLAP